MIKFSSVKVNAAICTKWSSCFCFSSFFFSLFSLLFYKNSNWLTIIAYFFIDGIVYFCTRAFAYGKRQGNFGAKIIRQMTIVWPLKCDLFSDLIDIPFSKLDFIINFILETQVTATDITVWFSTPLPTDKIKYLLKITHFFLRFFFLVQSWNSCKAKKKWKNCIFWEWFRVEIFIFKNCHLTSNLLVNRSTWLVAWASCIYATIKIEKMFFSINRLMQTALFFRC